MATKRLSVRIALAVGMLALLGAGFVSLLSYQRTQVAEIATAQRTLLQLGQTVQRTAAIAAYLDNKEIADDAILGLAKNEIVAAVMLTSVTGLSASHGNLAEQDPGKAVRLSLESPFTVGEIVGELAIYPRQDMITLNARAAALDRAMLLGGYTMVIALLVMGIIQWQFVPALKGVASELDAISPGTENRLTIPDKHGNNEIGSLVGNVNRLLDLVKDKLDSERGLRQEIQGLERRFRMIFERASVGIFMLDQRNRLIMANEAFREMSGNEAACLADKDVECLHRIFADMDRASEMVQETMTRGTLTTADLRLTQGMPDAPRWVHCLFTRLREDATADSASQIFVQGIIFDITERKQQEQLIRFQAERDPLTQLHNRRSAEIELASILEKARFENACVAVCLIDLDNFKPINDTHGHDAGDQVLVTIAERMRQTLRNNDLASRLGGDEFLVVIMGVSCRRDIEAVARKLLSNLTQEIELSDGSKVSVGCSMGIALSSEHGNNLSRMMALADRAMYSVKHRGKNDFQIYESLQT